MNQEGFLLMEWLRLHLKKALSNSKGMTLTELLVTISILGIMIAMATTGVGFIRNQSLAAADQELMADFQRIRQKAMTQGTPLVAGGSLSLNRGFGIRFASNASYVTFEFIETAPGNFQYDGTSEEYEETGLRDGSNNRIAPTAKTLPGSVTVTNGGATDPTGNVLLYDKHGMLRNTNWTLGGNVVYVLRIPNSSARPRCVSIDPVRIREGTWDGAACIVS